MTSPGRLPIVPDSQRPSADRPPPPNGGSRRRGLGRGLGALIPGAEAVTERPTEVALSRLRANPFQPREAMDPQEFSGLVESVRRHGVLQPIVARRAGDGFEVVAGERRGRAAPGAGLATAPSVTGSLWDQESLELGLVENLQRGELGSLDWSSADR